MRRRKSGHFHVQPSYAFQEMKSRARHHTRVRRNSKNTISIILEIPLTEIRVVHRLDCMSDLEQTASCLEALGNPTRLAVYRMLVRAGGDGRSVGQIQNELGIPASTLSHHLKHLELVRLVRRSRNGTTHVCVANYQMMDAVLGYLTEECCIDAGGHQEIVTPHAHDESLTRTD